MHHPTSEDEIELALREISSRFHELSFAERMKRMFAGFKADQDSREYKEARIEVQRFSAPAIALLVPLLLVVLVQLFARSGDDTTTALYEVRIEEPVETTKLIPEKLDPPEEMPELLPDVLTDIPMPIDTPVDIPIDTPITAQPAAFDSVLQIRSPVVLQGVYGTLRSAGSRGTALAAHGGDAQTEAAVMRALRWLKTKQNPNGSWNSGATGFALLAFLAHGERPGPSSPEFGDTVQKAIENLCTRSTGLNFIDTYAIAEAYGMTLHPDVGAAAHKAIERLIKRQHPNGQWGGNQGKPELLDMTFAVLALKAAKMAGLKVDGMDDAMKLAVNGFTLQGNPERGGFQSDAFGPPSASFRRSGTWHFMMGVFGMQYLGSGEEQVVKKTLQVLDSLWPPATLEKNDIACCPVRSNYYSTMVYFNAGGDRWRKWNSAMKKVYCEGQQIERGVYKDHNGADQEIGYWTCLDEHIGDQPLMPTVYISQQLMIYYRFLPSTTQKAWELDIAPVASLIESTDVAVDSGSL